jgi:hypothetical protein
MTEKDILDLIKSDPWMMDVISKAEKLNLKNWIIGAGFVRNKVWDYLHNINSKRTDVDLVYYDINGNNEKEDEILTDKLKKETGINWEIVNEYYAHVWNNFKPFKSTEDAISTWCETATGVGVTTKDGDLKLVTPHGIYDLVNLILKPSPAFMNNVDFVKERIKNKKWLETWPKLKLSPELQ